MTPTKDMLRPIDLAPLLGVGRGRVYQLIQSRALPCVRRGRTILIPRAAWERWLAEQASRALASARSQGEPAVAVGLPAGSGAIAQGRGDSVEPRS